MAIGYDLFAAHLQPLALAQSPAWTTQLCFSTDLPCVTTWPGTEKDADAVQVEGAEMPIWSHYLQRQHGRPCEMVCLIVVPGHGGAESVWRNEITRK